jgi:hypothetical protein
MNTFRNNKTALQVRDTADVTVSDNRFENVGSRFALEGKNPNFLVDPPILGSTILGGPDGLPGGMDPMIKEGQRRGRDSIVVDEWGPYDWKSPKLWPAGKPDDRPLKLRVLGPPGNWKVASVRGATVAARSGKVPDEIAVMPDADGKPGPTAVIDVELALEYQGAAIVSPRGARTAAGAPYTFRYSRFFVPIDWRVKLFEYTDATDPVKQPEAFARLLAGTPLKEVARDRLDYVSGRSIEEGIPRDRFALVAEGTADLPAGGYTMQLISDDGAKVWVDGEVVIDTWTPHESKVDRAPLAGGRRRFKIEYYEVGGFAELRFDIQRR